MWCVLHASQLVQDRLFLLFALKLSIALVGMYLLDTILQIYRYSVRYTEQYLLLTCASFFYLHTLAQLVMKRYHYCLNQTICIKNPHSTQLGCVYMVLPLPFQSCEEENIRKCLLFARLCGCTSVDRGFS